MSECLDRPLLVYVAGIPLVLLGLVAAFSLLTLCVWGAVAVVDTWIDWVHIMKRRLFK